MRRENEKKKDEKLPTEWYLVRWIEPIEFVGDLKWNLKLDNLGWWNFRKQHFVVWLGHCYISSANVTTNASSIIHISTENSLITRFTFKYTYTEPRLNDARRNNGQKCVVQFWADYNDAVFVICCFNLIWYEYIYVCKAVFNPIEKQFVYAGCNNPLASKI